MADALPATPAGDSLVALVVCESYRRWGGKPGGPASPPDGAGDAGGSWAEKASDFLAARLGPAQAAPFTPVMLEAALGGLLPEGADVDAAVTARRADRIAELRAQLQTAAAAAEASINEGEEDEAMNDADGPEDATTGEARPGRGEEDPRARGAPGRTPGPAGARPRRPAAPPATPVGPAAASTPAPGGGCAPGGSGGPAGGTEDAFFLGSTLKERKALAAPLLVSVRVLLSHKYAKPFRGAPADAVAPEPPAPAAAGAAGGAEAPFAIAAAPVPTLLSLRRRLEEGEIVLASALLAELGRMFDAALAGMEPGSTPAKRAVELQEYAARELEPGLRLEEALAPDGGGTRSARARRPAAAGATPAGAGAVGTPASAAGPPSAGPASAGARGQRLVDVARALHQTPSAPNGRGAGAGYADCGPLQLPLTSPAAALGKENAVPLDSAAGGPSSLGLKRAAERPLEPREFENYRR